MEYVFAYLDPGTGSVILQAVVGGLLGGIFILRSKLMQGGRALSRMFAKQPKVAEGNTSSTNTSEDS